MKTVTPELIEAIRELQNLPSLKAALLGGGTNLAIRYGHRQSVDIDLFFPGIIGRTGYEEIKQEVKSLYDDRAYGYDYPYEISDQYMFLRFFVRTGELSVKVEILQNMQAHLPGETIDGMQLMQEADIARLKILAGCNRATQKDIFDLDYLTDRIKLPHVMDALKDHQEKYSAEEYKSIFDLDGEKSPVDDPGLLLKFDDQTQQRLSRPIHSNPRVEIMGGQKNWLAARSSWRLKVRRYYRMIGYDYPSTQS